MRTRALFALVIGVTAIVAACSGSSLTGKTWQLTAITEKVPAFQGVVPAADQANYTIEFKSDGTFNAKADCNQLSGTYTSTRVGRADHRSRTDDARHVPRGIAVEPVRGGPWAGRELRDRERPADDHAHRRRDARLQVGSAARRRRPRTGVGRRQRLRCEREYRP